MITGCGGSSDDFVMAPVSPAQVGNIEVRQVLLRSIPSQVTQQRFSGFTSSGSLVYGPETRDKAAVIELTNVSTSVTRLQIEYFAGQTLVGIGTIPVSVTLGQTTVVNDPPFDDVSAALTSLEVAPATSTIALGTSQRYTATGRYADGSSLDLSSLVDWSSLEPAVATIDSAGFASAVSTGQTTIVASLGEVSDSAELSVSSASVQQIVVTPLSATIALGTQQDFTAVASLSDGTYQDVTSSASWSSSTPAVSTVNGRLASAVAVGQSTISATVGQVTGSASLTVSDAVPLSLTVEPANPVIAKGTEQAFTARLNLSDGSFQDVTGTATWTSATLGVATMVDNTATGLSPGQSAIAASSGDFQGQAVLTVTEATITGLSVDPAEAMSAPGSRRQYRAVAQLSDGTTQDVSTQVVWASSSSNVAISNTSLGPNRPGRAAIESSTALASTATITATLGALEATSTLHVNRFAYAGIQGLPGQLRHYSTTASGALTFLNSIDVTRNVGELVMAPNGMQIYGYLDIGSSQVIGFTLGADGVPTQLALGDLPITAPETIAIHPSGRFLYVGGGEALQQYRVETDGTLTALGAVSGISSASDVVVHPSGNFVYVAFNERIYEYSVGDDGLLSPLAGTPLDGMVIHNSLATHPDGAILYSAESSADTVSSYRVESDGKLAFIGSESSSIDPQFTLVDPLGRFVYAVSFVTQLMESFAVGLDGALQLADSESLAGTPVRPLAADPTGKFLLLGSSAGSLISVQVDDNGTLTLAAPVATPDQARGVAVTP
jgi:6-phosphogluconolactonase (cycloisomerase 2 family)